MDWSEYQKAIFEDVSSGTGHTIVEAVAGSGKSTTLLESLNFIPSDASWLVVAFNKKIAEEMKRKAPRGYGGDIRTLHSLGLRALRNKWPKLQLVEDKSKNYFDDKLGAKKHWDAKMQLCKTVSLCKGYLIEGAEFIDYIMDNHDIDTFDLGRDEFVKLVQSCLKAAKNNVKKIDFDDMIWLVHVHNVFVQKYHRVFIDEAQDLNNAQIQLALRACKRNGRIMALGDKFQAIYRFRGASHTALDNIKTKLGAKELPLSITYRCPLSVVKEAQKIVPHIEAAPDAKKGIVKHIYEEDMMRDAKAGCFILSRTNAPMISIALAFIRKGTPASIQGRDIGANLLNLIKKSRRKGFPAFLSWLLSLEKKEVKRLQKKDRPIDHIKDRAACLRAIADVCSDLDDLKEQIHLLFDDTNDTDRIILSTVHRAKGMERDVVFMLMNTFKGGNQEERNIRYVSITRSASELYFVT